MDCLPAQSVPSRNIPPLGWGKDSLSEFLELAQRNRYATFANKSEWYQKLSKLDDCFLRVGKGWINPPDLVTPLLYQRAHSAFRAAAGLAMSGQVTDLYPQIRACLEYAAYGLHIGENPASVDVWIGRHSGPAGIKAVKTEFTIANVRESISERDRHSAEVFDILYQRAIDFGGHPNERSVSGSMAMNEMEDRMEFLQMHLHGDGTAFLQGLKTTAQTGVCALEIFQCLYAARYELLGVRADLLNLRRCLLFENTVRSENERNRNLRSEKGAKFAPDPCKIRAVNSHQNCGESGPPFEIPMGVKAIELNNFLCQ